MGAEPAIDPIDRHLGARLRAARRRRGLSQAELAKALGDVFQQVQRYESGLNRISAATLWRATEALDADVADFFPARGSGARPREAAPEPVLRPGAAFAAAYAALPPARRAILLRITNELARGS
jgi:transcriptional regulator with XRE-family HTH domain